MKITFVLPGYMWKPAGGYRVVYEYANQLTVRGHEVSVVHPRILRSDDLLPSNPYQWLRWKARCLRNLLFKPNVSRWQPINKQVKMLYVPEPTAQYVPDGDAIFATAWQTTEYVAEYPANKGEKFYLVMDFGDYMGSQEKLEASWELPFKKVTISQWLYQQVASIAEGQDMTNIPLGIDFNRFKKIGDIHNRSKRIAMMYSFYAKYKAVDDGIQALKICKDKYPDLQVTLFGNYRTPKIPSWIDYRYNVSDAELIDIYNQSRIFICSSLAEGFAFPPAEAMACGCAVVSTDCGGNREYAIDGVTALLSPPNDPEALAKNVIRLLEADDLRIKLAQSGYEYIQQFTWERSTNLLEQFITRNIKPKTLRKTMVKQREQNNSGARQYPKIAIIIINWNGKHYLDTCLSSLLNQTYKDFEIIMVDNASTDGSVKYVQAKYPVVNILKTNENLGFAKGCNVGMRASNADYIVALSNDTRVEPNWLEELVKVAETDERIGICGSKLVLMDTPDTYNSAGFFIIWNAFIYDRAPGKKVGKYETLEKVDGVCAASALYRKKMLDEIGLLDERLFFGHDDIDLSWRAKNAGWKAMYVPASVCYHKMLGSVKGKKLHDQFHVDAVWVRSKNSNLLGLAGIALFLFAQMIKAIIWQSMGKDRNYKPFWKALKAIPTEWKNGEPFRRRNRKELRNIFN